MLKYPCLVLDHDDTVVQSEATVNYPCFCDTLAAIRPGTKITLEAYAQGCSDLGFDQMCQLWYRFSEQELAEEYQFWKQYSKTHIPAPVPGIREIIHTQKVSGGTVIVVSHSKKETIIRDYRTHFGIEPDDIYDCELPEKIRKPAPYPIFDIMKKRGFAPQDLLVVDDMKPGYDMAKAAGVEIAFAGWARKSFPGIYKEMKTLCDFTFDRTEELSAFLF